MQIYKTYIKQAEIELNNLLKRQLRLVFSSFVDDFLTIFHKDYE